MDPYIIVAAGKAPIVVVLLLFAPELKYWQRHDRRVHVPAKSNDDDDDDDDWFIKLLSQQPSGQ